MKTKKVRDQNSSKTQKVVFYFVLVSMILSFFYAFANIFIAPLDYSEVDTLIKNDYILMAMQAFGGTFLLFIPSLIEKRFKVYVPPVLVIAMLLFLYAAIILGEFRRFHFIVPGWDKLLHIFSGSFLALLSFSIISLLNEYDIIHMNPLFVSLFAFCFAMTIGALWEIYEFLWDYFGDLNMQKYANEQGVPYVGKEALFDTMMDFIVDAIGAFAVSFAGFFALKYRRSWFNSLMIQKIDKKQ